MVLLYFIVYHFHMNSRSEAAYDVQYCPKRGTQLYNWISRKYDHELPGWKRGCSLIWEISGAWHHMMVRCRGTLWIHYWLVELDWKKGAWFMGRSQICTCGRASRRAWNPYSCPPLLKFLTGWFKIWNYPWGIRVKCGVARFYQTYYVVFECRTNFKNRTM